MPAIRLLACAPIKPRMHAFMSFLRTPVAINCRASAGTAVTKTTGDKILQWRSGPSLNIDNICAFSVLCVSYAGRCRVLAAAELVNGFSLHCCQQAEDMHSFSLSLLQVATYTHQLA
eukprot:350259-Chlamydomonas_euryale.AAC.7